MKYQLNIMTVCRTDSDRFLDLRTFSETIESTSPGFIYANKLSLDTFLTESGIECMKQQSFQFRKINFFDGKFAEYEVFFDSVTGRPPEPEVRVSDDCTITTGTVGLWLNPALFDYFQ